MPIYEGILETAEGDAGKEWGCLENKAFSKNEMKMKFL